MSRLGRALIEIALKGHEQAKAQLTEIKGELKDLSGSGASTGPGQKGLDDLKAQFARVRGEVEALGKTSQSAGAEGVTAFGGMGVALTGIGTIIGSTIALFAELEKRWKEASRDSQALAAEREITRVRLSDIRAQIDGHSQLERAKQRDREEEKQEIAEVSSQNDRSMKGRMDQIEEIRNRHSRLRAEMAALDEKSGADATDAAAEKRAALDMERVKQLTAARLSGMEKIDAEQQAVDDEINARRLATTNDNELEALAKRKAASDEYFAYERMKWGLAETEREEREKRSQEEREKRDQEAAQRQAAILEAAMERAAEKFRNSLTAAVASALASQQAASNSSLDQLTANVANIASIVQMRLRSNGVNLSSEGEPYGRP